MHPNHKEKNILPHSLNKAMQALYIDSPEQLAALCARLRGQTWVALDTEFMREKTYYAQFCLLQLAGPDWVACIDPLALTDIGALLDVLYDPAITKVMHSARQDLELFYDLRGELPGPVFDTQIAAALLGYGDQVSYAALVRGMLDVDLDKAHTRTDWSRRPLDPAQLRYAADDVRYLAHVYLCQRDALNERGRTEWLHDDFAELTDKRKYANTAHDAWYRIRQANTLKGVQWAVLRALAAWREEGARAADKPRKWIIADEVLVELARHTPTDAQALAKVRGLDTPFIKRSSTQLLDIIRAAKALPKEQWPRLEPVQRLDARQEALVDTLMAVVRTRGTQNTVSPAVLTTRKELEQLVLGRRDTSVLRGWRAALVGQELLEILQGRLTLQVRDGDLCISPA